jgi:hypothetical protein
MSAAYSKVHPEVKEWLNNVIIPALVAQHLAENGTMANGPESVQ